MNRRRQAVGRGRTSLLRRLLRLSSDSRGQVLPLALAALALGTLLVSPFLVDASVNLLASRHVDTSIRDYYSTDAGVEWALWRLKANPTLTASTSYTAAPLQPTPAAINGSPFPTTEIRRVPGGSSETITRDGQSDAGPHCYDFATSESGLVFAIVDVEASNVWMTLLSGADACEKPLGLGPMATPYRLQFSDIPSGSKLLVEIEPPQSAIITINYPVAAYDIRSERNGRTITSRAAAGANAVEIISWQLE